MQVIRILPERLVNQIAAGEVIERPAAAVKELVENALDAGARRIAVALDGGGIGRIEVTDDGCGMSPESLALAVLRHATSKLSDDDLVAIRTLGFRGEALPSIGAAGRLKITSRPRGAAHASSIAVEGGRVSPVVPAAGPVGTQVVVEDLFFATPARRKFLKQPRTEADYAGVALRRLAIAAPHVAFQFEIDQRAVFDLPAQERIARVAALLGPDAESALLPVEATRGGLTLSGYIASPAVTRATAASLAFTVNGRPVVDPLLRTAARVAYRDVIASGRYPIVALWIDLPAEELDVNVHPAKAELRFRDPGLMRSLVIGAIGRALSSGAGTGVPLPRPALARPPLTLWPRPAEESRASATGMADAQLPLQAPPSSRPLPHAVPNADHPLGAAIGQVSDTYVIAVTADGGLVLVDQHAAHERLTHEALRAQLLDGGVRRQPLLVPAVVDLSSAEARRLLAQSHLLDQLGLEIEPFGPGAVLIRALPAALGSPDPTGLLRDLAEELAEGEAGEGGSTALAVRLDAAIARMACHGSVRAGRRLAQAEMDALLRQMESTPRAATCSHGRPTVLKFSRSELAALFRRGV